MFNESNIENRSRHFVRGRVLVFTTSSHVEFLNEALTCSIPLWYHLRYEKGYGLSFCVEIDGFLTFDYLDSYGDQTQTKIIEVSPFRALDYDPQRFAITKPADSFVSRVTARSVYTMESRVIYTISVTYTLEAGGTATVLLTLTPPRSSVGSEAYLDTFWAVGSKFLGANNYPDTDPA